MKPCDKPEVARELPCVGPDGCCYGKPCWDKKPFGQGELRKIKVLATCAWVEQCRDWWPPEIRREEVVKPITDTTRPICRYHGGKWKLAPWVLGHFPAHEIYVEPFAGMASVLLRKPRAKCEVVNDLDQNVVDLFRVLRDPEAAEDLRRRCHLTPYSRAELEATWTDQDEADPVERARRYLARSTMSYSSKGSIMTIRGGFRNSRRGEVSPAVDWAKWPEALPSLVERLRGVVVEQRDALEVLNIYDSEATLFYVDPPYVKSTRVLKHGKYRHELTDEGHEALATRLRGLRGMVVLSGYACELYDRLYAGWRRADCTSYADVASPRTESLWLNPQTLRRLQPLLMAAEA